MVIVKVLPESVVPDSVWYILIISKSLFSSSHLLICFSTSTGASEVLNIFTLWLIGLPFFRLFFEKILKFEFAATNRSKSMDDFVMFGYLMLLRALKVQSKRSQICLKWKSYLLDRHQCGIVYDYKWGLILSKYIGKSLQRADIYITDYGTPVEHMDVAFIFFNLMNCSIFWIFCHFFTH